MDSINAFFRLLPDYRFEPTWIAPDAMPEPYDALLVHDRHMTVTVERHHGSPCSLRVLKSIHDSVTDDYARAIVLDIPTRGGVLFGLVRIHLRELNETMRQEILTGEIPLGRILIEHDILRTVRPTSYFQTPAPGVIASALGIPEGTVLYGRTGEIWTNHKPTIEVVELVLE